jgi:VWFA-related protein
MMRLALAAVALSVAVGAAQQPPAPSARKLRIAAAAVDRDGRPVTDLRPSELEVWIGIYRVPIETVTFVSPAGGQGRILVLVLDDMTIVDPTMGMRVKEAARIFVTKMGPDDQMSILSLDGGAAKATGDRAALLKRIEAYNPLGVPRLPLDRLGQHVLQTLTSIARSLIEVPGRKTIVGIGSSWVFDTPIPPPTEGMDLRPEWIAAVRAMASADATLYVVDPGGVGRAPFATGGSTGFARETGGHAFANTNDAARAADRILAEAATYYVLEVSDPPIGKNAELREVDVRTSRKGITVRARRWIPGGKVPKQP